MPSATKRLSHQIVFRISEEMAKALDELAPRYGQDTSGFLRLVLCEQVPTYKRRAERMEKGQEEEERG